MASTMTQVLNTRHLSIKAPDSYWRVDKGSVDVFVQSSLAKGRPRFHLARFQAGDLIFGLTDEQPELDIVIQGHNGCQLSGGAIADLDAQGASSLSENPLSTDFDAYIKTCLAGLFRFSKLPNGVKHRLSADEAPYLFPDDILTGPSGILWISVRQGQIDYGGWTRLSGGLDSRVPMSVHAWVMAHKKSHLEVETTAGILRNGHFSLALQAFNGLLWDILFAVSTHFAEERQEHMQRRTALDKTLMQAVLQSFLRRPSRSDTYENLDWSPDAQTLQWLIIHQQSTFQIPRQFAQSQGIRPLLDHCGLYYRPVRLSTDWWQNSQGSFVGFLNRDQQPVALLFDGDGYILQDAVRPCRLKVNAAVAATLSSQTLEILLPDDKELSFPSSRWQQLRLLFRLKGWIIPLLIVLQALLLLLLPVMLQLAIDYLAPSADLGLLRPFLTGSILLALVYMAVRTRLSAVGKQVHRQVAQALAQRHILTLMARDDSPEELTTHYRRFAGLVDDGIRCLDDRFWTTINACSCLVLLLYVYAAALPLGLMLSTMMIPIVFSVMRNPDPNIVDRARVFKLFRHILPIMPRIALFRAQTRFFARLISECQTYIQAKQTRLWAYYRRSAGIIAYMIFGILCLYVLISFPYAGLSLGQQLAVIVVWLVMLGCFAKAHVVGPTIALDGALTLPVPFRPNAYRPSKFLGQIDIRRLSYRYDGAQDPVLNRITFSLSPGECVLLVGPSGSGKSTLFDLLLGLRRPSQGAIYYDGVLLDRYDTRFLRRQIATVMQGEHLFPGDLLTNLLGERPADDADIWEALHIVGMANFVGNLPMGLYTVVTTTGDTFSSGQVQRLLLARAILAKPKLLFLDEIASALNPEEFDALLQRLRHMGVGIILISHREDAARFADRRLYLDKGTLHERPVSTA